MPRKTFQPRHKIPTPTQVAKGQAKPEEETDKVTKTQLRKLKMDDLRAFAKEKGLDVADTKKDELIEEILEALDQD